MNEPTNNNQPVNFEAQVRSLPGPILILGAGGFIGANLAQSILSVRSDVKLGVKSVENWRFDFIQPKIKRNQILVVNINDVNNLGSVIEKENIQCILHAATYGGYSFEQDWEKIHETNYSSLVMLLERVKDSGLKAFVHAGSSSEYGLNAAGPMETDALEPNSHYAISKGAASLAIKYYGNIHKLPIANLRLYSVYGQFEDPARLIPNLIKHAQNGSFPPLANASISRDYIHIDDVCRAYVHAALAVSNGIGIGESFNIGTGTKTTLGDLMKITQEAFDMQGEAEFGSYVNRAWDVNDWYANTIKSEQILNFRSGIDLSTGLKRTAEWQLKLETLSNDRNFNYWNKSKNKENIKPSIAAIITIYRDEQAIPFMYQRLVETFKKIDVDYKIVFVNDCSPDNAEAAIISLTAKDSNVIGITHSRNFGSQMAFVSGMLHVQTDAIVLLDGDLQDPPELIEQFYKKWQQGFEVIYGERASREMSKSWHALYKLFYKIFDTVSDFSIPRNAGDFSLIDRRVYEKLKTCEERDLFLRGLRAYVGFKQIGVPYNRPERMFGKSTNSLIANFNWAKKAIFSYSSQPLNILTLCSIALFLIATIFALYAIAVRFIDPGVPRGITTLVSLILFFGSVNLLGISILGEYIGKIIQEVKQRPRFIVDRVFKNGKRI